MDFVQLHRLRMRAVSVGTCILASVLLLASFPGLSLHPAAGAPQGFAGLAAMLVLVVVLVWATRFQLLRREVSSLREGDGGAALEDAIHVLESCPGATVTGPDDIARAATRVEAAVRSIVGFVRHDKAGDVDLRKALDGLGERLLAAFLAHGPGSPGVPPRRTWEHGCAASLAEDARVLLERWRRP